MNKEHSVLAVRFDGNHERTDFGGYRAEMLSDRLFKELKEDPKFLFVVQFANGQVRAQALRQ